MTATSLSLLVCSPLASSHSSRCCAHYSLSKTLTAGSSHVRGKLKDLSAPLRLLQYWHLKTVGGLGFPHRTHRGDAFANYAASFICGICSINARNALTIENPAVPNQFTGRVASSQCSGTTCIYDICREMFSLRLWTRISFNDFYLRSVINIR